MINEEHKAHRFGSPTAHQVKSMSRQQKEKQKLNWKLLSSIVVLNTTFVVAIWRNKIQFRITGAHFRIRKCDLYANTTCSAPVSRQPSE